jgi:hypothetical protein
LKIRSVLVAVAVAAALGSMLALTPASAQSTVSAGASLATGLLSPRGMKMGPDGMLYVAEAGSGGDTVVTVGGQDSHVGTTGRISKIDPATGARTTVIDGLPSNAGPEGDSVGPADVAFSGTTLYYIQTHGGDAYGFPGTPTGLYKVAGGSATLVADIGAYNIANPVNDVASGTQLDIEPGGNPYSLTVRDGVFYVVDGNQNQVMQITADGTISRLTEFPGHPVTTGIAQQGNSGPFYVSTLGQFPFSADAGTVVRVGVPTGNRTKVAGGVSSLTDVEFGPGGQLYAVSFGDQATDLGAPAPWNFFSGKILKVNTSTGEMTPVVTGFMFPTSLIFVGDTAYVSNGGVSIPGLVDGEIWKIENFSSVQPPAPEPTAAPTQAAPTATPTGGTGTISGPNTGNGGMDPLAPEARPAWIALALAVAAAALGGAGRMARRRG